MAIQVPVDVEVNGLAPLDALDRTLDDIADPRTGTVGLDTSQAVAAAAALDKLLDQAVEERTAEVDVDVTGLGNIDRLRASLDMSKERAEIAALEKALDSVAKLREAGVDVEVDGQKELAALDKALAAVERRRTAHVDIDVDNDSFKRAVGAATESSSAISEAFGSAFQLVARNAVILTAAVAAAFAAFPVIGAVAGTGLVLGFGGAIAGVGILAAAQSERVKEAFGEMADGIVAEMKRIAAPLEGTLVSVAFDIEQAFTNMVPTFEDAFEQMAQSLTGFSDQFFDAFQNLEPAVQPLTDAFTNLLDAIGPRLDEFFTNVADSVTHLSDVINADPELFASLFVGLLNIIPFVIDLVADLAATFQIIADLVSTHLAPAFADFQAAFGPLGDAFAKATGGLSLFKLGLGTTVAFVGAVVIAISATLRAVAGIVSGFRAAGRAISDTWQNTRTVTINAWNAVRAAVSRAVSAVAGAINNGMANARAAVSNAMARIRGVFSSAWAAISGVVTGGIARVRSVISSGLSAAAGAASNAWGRIRAAFSSGVSNALSIVRRLPGAILGIFGGLAGSLFSSGYSMISSLASGIRSGFSAAISAAADGMSRLRSFFPFSPAKRGPFSGTGYTTYSGKALVEDFADSITKTAAAVSPDVARALNPLAESFATPDVSGPPVGSGTPPTGAGAPSAFGGDLVAAFAALFAQMRIDVVLGMDRRTTATLWLEGQRLAETLS